jgi:periplasmic protein CpxP/Spy
MKMFLGALVLVAGLVTTSVIGFAQQGTAQEKEGRGRGERQWKHEGDKGEHGMRGGFGPFGRTLNLTDAQKAQMQQIAERFRESTKSLHEQMRSQRQNGFGAFNEGAFNEAAVRAAAQARANVEVEMEVARARMMSEMYAVLTPEQKAQLAKEREQWKQKMSERRARRGADSDAKQ